MSLFFKKSPVVPEKEEDIVEFLSEISDYISNLSDNNATGDVHFDIQKPENKGDRWIIDVNGQISDGQDLDGNELWKEPDLHTYYEGLTLKEAAEKILHDVILNYR